MKKIMTILFMLIVSSVANAGGSIGGGTGLTQEEIALSIADNANLLGPITIPDLGLKKTVAVEPDVYRRTRARLSVRDIVPVAVNGDEITFKSLRGGIADLEEKSQLTIAK